MPDLSHFTDTGAPIDHPPAAGFMTVWARGQDSRRSVRTARRWRFAAMAQPDVRARCHALLRGQGLRATELTSKSSYRRHLPKVHRASLVRSDRNWRI